VKKKPSVLKFKCKERRKIDEKKEKEERDDGRREREQERASERGKVKLQLSFSAPPGTPFA
jgi:hypothetical protein